MINKEVLRKHEAWVNGEVGGERANLQNANLQDADLWDAGLQGAKLNWISHDLLSEILRRAAGDDIDKRMAAGLLLVSRDWCWRDMARANGDDRHKALLAWAIEMLRPWADEAAPKIFE